MRRCGGLNLRSRRVSPGRGFHPLLGASSPVRPGGLFFAVKGLPVGFGRSNRYRLPKDARAQAIAETNAFLSWALSTDRPPPRIPRRPVAKGGFSEMMRRPLAAKIVAHWWSEALERVTDR